MPDGGLKRIMYKEAIEIVNWHESHPEAIYQS